MPVITTSKDNYGRLRSIATYKCKDCNEITSVRLDEFKRRGDLCKKCKIAENSRIEFNSKDLELTCAAIFKSRINKRYIKRGLTCNLTTEEVLNLVKSNCHYCGDGFSNLLNYNQPHFKYKFYYNGIDRIDSSKGYIRGNVVSCCKTCNVSKMDMDYNKFINHIKKIYNNLKLCQL
jgi:hypothetical protein